MEIAAAGFRSEGFDATERAFVEAPSQPLRCPWRASWPERLERFRLART